MSNINVEGVREVDDKLIVLGKQLKSPVCLIKTSDNATRDLLCKSVVPYITKSRMFARPKLPKGVDLFFRGKIKKPSS